MSYSALLYGMKAFYLQNLTYNNKPLDTTMVDVTVDSRPPATAGEVFISIYGGQARGGSQEILEVTHSANVTVTMRTTQFPFDRVGVLSVLDKDLGLGKLIQDLMESTHLNYEILRLAWQWMGNIRSNPFVEPLRFLSCTPPRFADSNIYHSEEPAPEVAIVQTITFGECKRVQFGTWQPHPPEVPLYPSFYPDKDKVNSGGTPLDIEFMEAQIAELLKKREEDKQKQVVKDNTPDIFQSGNQELGDTQE